MITLLQGDVVQVFKTLEPASFSSLVCDPPYGLSFMGKKWDSEKEVSWHTAWGVEALRLLKPGALLLAFGGARTYHRLVSGLEAAGFEIRDGLMWLYGQGYPKQKSGLKPAFEPIVLARKELSESTIKANVKKHGTGGLFVNDGTRVSGGRHPANVLVTHAEGCELLGMKKEERVQNVEPKKDGEIHSEGWGTKQMLTRVIEADVEDWSCVVTCPLSVGVPRFFYSGKAAGKEKWALCKCGSVVSPDEKEKHEEHGGLTTHPTQKPEALMRYLIRLVTPKGGEVLVPFSGSGSALAAAKSDGFDAVGVELEPDYIRLSRARLGLGKEEHLCKNGHPSDKPNASGGCRKCTSERIARWREEESKKVMPIAPEECSFSPEVLGVMDDLAALTQTKQRRAK